ncbi:MAG: hypothetical protein NTW19_17465 [Planctomycetota bacterium]|nr:hypothetical protein [Planctomycetota bacterium]
MTRLLDHLVLDRTGPADASVGMISLPLPRALAPSLRVDHPASATHPVGWWERNKIPRRSLAWVVDNAGVPETLRLTDAPAKTASSAPSPRWTAVTRISREKLTFTARSFYNIADLRGVPYEETTYVEYELLLTYGQRTLVIQLGATGPDTGGGGGPFWWQNVQVDPIWENSVVQAFRVGGVVYNGDTYLWGDLYLQLFSNGVANVAAHFLNTKLHIEGYDFQGLPEIRFSGNGGKGINLPPVRAELPAAGDRFAWGGLQLNLADARGMASAENPGRLEGHSGDLLWRPWSRTFNPQLAAAPREEWAPGFARTARFQFSLSDEAAPVVARYRAPPWWYVEAGEPWPGGYLPVRGQFDRLGELTADHLRTLMARGRFDAGNAQMGNDGDTGIGIMRNAYRTGRADLYADALDYCYYWADLAVDHREYTVHQWIGGWGWRTCAYSKFRDVFMGYLETGDPYLFDTATSVAEQYWNWFRSNWPRCSVGRDAFEIGGWALLRRFMGTEHTRDRTREFIRMIKLVVDDRGSIGGQMGAGPHPGFYASLYMTGVSMISTLEVLEAEAEEDASRDLAPMHQLLATLSGRFLRDDVELFPSNLGNHRPEWSDSTWGVWAVLALRIYAQMARLPGIDPKLVAAGFAKIQQRKPQTIEAWAASGRMGNNLANPIYHDALVLGARWTGTGVELSPITTPDAWPAEQTIATPVGPLVLRTQAAEGKATLKFEAAMAFPVTVKLATGEVKTSSQGEVRVG